MVPEVIGGDDKYRARIVGAYLKVVDAVPGIVGMRPVHSIVVSGEPGVVQGLARYSHADRVIRVSPNLGANLDRVIAHEVGHAVDDHGPDAPHAWSSSERWRVIHRMQPTFELPAYRADPREFFADTFAKVVLLGERYRPSAPAAVDYVRDVVFPALRLWPTRWQG